MRKMPCLFVREFHGRSSFTLTREVTPGCEWVLAGEGIATIKRDGTACMIKDGELYARYDAKRGKQPPPGAIPCDPEPDAVTGHWPHWVKVGSEPQFVWHREAWEQVLEDVRRDQGRDPSPYDFVDGTYELCGPKLQGNPEKLTRHIFIRHGSEPAHLAERSFDAIRRWLEINNVEGIVFHHPDGRMVKIRRDDYGLPWGSKGAT